MSILWVLMLHRVVSPSQTTSRPLALRVLLSSVAVGRHLIGYSKAGQFSFIPVVFSRRKYFQIPTENRSGRMGTFLDLIIPPRPKFILFCFVRNTVWFENILSGILPIRLIFPNLFYFGTAFSNR
jgi:hypothetical protein